MDGDDEEAWYGPFRDHGVHPMVADLIEEVRSNEPDHVAESDVDSQQRFCYRRLIQALEMVQERLSGSNPLLTPISMLDNCHSHAVKVKQHWDAWYQNPNSVSGVMAAIDNLVSWIVHLPGQQAATSPELLSAWVKDYRHDAIEAMKVMRGELDEMRAVYEEQREELAQLEGARGKLASDLKAAEQRIEDLAQSQEQRFTDSQEKHNQSIEKLRGTFADLIEESKQEHADAFAALTKSDAERRAEADERLGKSELEYEARVAMSYDKLQKQSDGIIVHLEELSSKAQRAFNLALEGSIIGSYSRAARHDWWAGNILRGVAIICYVLMAVMTYVVIDSAILHPGGQSATVAGVETEYAEGEELGHGASDESLPEESGQRPMNSGSVPEVVDDQGALLAIVLRTGVIFVLLFPAVYCGREARRHFESSEKNRRLALEMESFIPYIDQLEPEGRQKAMAEKLHDFFKGHNGHAGSGGKKDKVDAEREA